MNVNNLASASRGPVLHALTVEVPRPIPSPSAVRLLSDRAKPKWAELFANHNESQNPRSSYR